MASSSSSSAHVFDRVDGLEFSVSRSMMEVCKALLLAPSESQVEVAEPTAEFKGAPFSYIYYTNWSYKLSIEDERAVDSWVDKFIVSPSLHQVRTDCRVDQPHGHDVGAMVRVRHGWISEMTSQKSLSAITRAEEFEKSFMETVLLIFGHDNPKIPRHGVGTGQSLKYFYRFDSLRYWLAQRTEMLPTKFAELTDEELSSSSSTFGQACAHYRMAHQSFVQIRRDLLALSIEESFVDGNQVPFSTHLMWRWLLLFQMIGEHIHFALDTFPDRLHHFRGHPKSGLDKNVESKLAQLLHYLPREWGSNDGLNDFRLLRMGRCPSEEGFIASFTKAKLSTLQLQVQNDLTRIPCEYGGNSSDDVRDYFQAELGKHCDCTSKSCNATFLPTEMYEPKHAAPGCYDCTHVGPNIEDVKRIINLSNVKVPLVQMIQTESSEHDIQLRVIPRQKHTKYVAISHVWSEGRGNVKENKLPQCQLAYIYKICQLHRCLPVWMDTLCIPVKEEDREERYRAIATMNDIYLNASEVIVICDDLLKLDYTPKIDIWLAFRTCLWMRRGWTLQEGAFGGRNLHVAFKDKLVDLHAEPDLWPHFRFYSPVFDFTRSLTRIFSHIQGDATDDSLSTAMTITHIFEEFRWRRTKLAEDEPVIFAGLLGLNPEPLLRVNWDITKSRSLSWRLECLFWRLELLYERIQEFPTNVLFSRVARLLRPGLRWAPRTFNIQDWTQPETFQGGFGSLSNLTGVIRPEGLDLWAHLILIDTRSTNTTLPEFFTIELQQRDPQSSLHRSVCLGVSALDVESDDDHLLDAFGNDADEAQIPGLPQSIFRPSSKSDIPSQYYAIVLKGFNRDIALREDLEVEAAIVKVTDGVDYYKSSYNSHREGSLVQRVWNKFRVPLPLHGTYIRPVRVHSLQDKDINHREGLDKDKKFVSLGTYKGRGKGKEPVDPDDSYPIYEEFEQDFNVGSTESEQKSLLASGSTIVQGEARRRKLSGLTTISATYSASAQPSDTRGLQSMDNNTTGANQFDGFLEGPSFSGLYCDDTWKIIIG